MEAKFSTTAASAPVVAQVSNAPEPIDNVGGSTRHTADFHYDEEEEKRKFRRDVSLKDQDGELFYDKLHFKFLQMPMFKKQAHELETHFDKWIYFLKNLETFDHIPSILNEEIFKKGFDIAEISHLKPKQYEAYQKSLLEYWEVKNVMETSFEEGKIKGKSEREREMAVALKKQGVAIEIISAEVILNHESFN